MDPSLSAISKYQQHIFTWTDTTVFKLQCQCIAFFKNSRSKYAITIYCYIILFTTVTSDKSALNLQPTHDGVATKRPNWCTRNTLLLLSWCFYIIIIRKYNSEDERPRSFNESVGSLPKRLLFWPPKKIKYIIIYSSVVFRLATSLFDLKQTAHDYNSTILC